jgi:hypothetical protein
MGINAEPAIDDPMTGERDSRRKQQSTRHLEHAVVLADVKAEPPVAAARPALTSSARDGGGNPRSGRKKACGAVEQKKWTKRKKASRLTGPPLI